MARNHNPKKCARCGHISRNQLIIPKGFRQAGKTICKKCEDAIVDFLLKSPIPHKESEDDK